MRLVSLALTALVLTGCYRSFELAPEDDAGPPVDAPPAPPDAGPRDTGVDAPLGPRCERDLDCAGLAPDAACVRDDRVRPIDLDRVDLACGSLRSGARPGSSCDRNDDCDHGLCSLAGGCLAPCASDGDCGAGERCVDVPVVMSESALETARACARRVDAPSDVRVEVVDGASPGGFTHQIVLPPATGARALHIIEPRELDGVLVEELRARDAAGTSLFDFATPSPINPVVGITLAPVLIPNGTRRVVSPEGHVVRLSTGSSSPLDRISLQRDTAPGGMLEVQFVYLGASAVPSGGRPPRAMARAIDLATELFAAAGVQLVATRHVRVPGATAGRLGMLDEDEALEVLAMSVAAGRPVLTVFVVRSMTFALGFAGGVPGPQTMNGTSMSGVALALDDILDTERALGVELLGTALAHEIGHYLGLFHSTELDGSSADPLDDTPRCPIANDRDRDGILYATECLDFDGRNVMFWGPIAGDSRFSAEQGAVIADSMMVVR